MRAELASADSSLLDHSVESVLPGVHQYLSSIHTEVRATRTDLTSLTQKVADCSDSKIRKVVKEAVQDSLGPALQPYSSLANSLNVMAASLRSGLQVQTATAIIVNPPSVEQESPSDQGPREDDDDAGDAATPSSAPPLLRDVVGSRPKPTYVSIHELYNEFYGLGEFEGKPVAGGLAKLDELFKTKWRQGFSGGQKKEWSRLTQTIVGINAHIVELGGDKGKALDNLNVVFQEKLGVNHTTSKMVKHMQESGLLVKGTPRGRYAVANRLAV
jgi:hypothetical protein